MLRQKKKTNITTTITTTKKTQPYQKHLSKTRKKKLSKNPEEFCRSNHVFLLIIKIYLYAIKYCYCYKQLYFEDICVLVKLLFRHYNSHLKWISFLILDLLLSICPSGFTFIFPVFHSSERKHREAVI